MCRFRLRFFLSRGVRAESSAASAWPTRGGWRLADGGWPLAALSGENLTTFGRRVPLFPKSSSFILRDFSSCVHFCG